MPPSNRLAGAAARILGVSPPFDPKLNFISSPFFSILALGAIRLFFAVYTFATLLVVLIWQSARLHEGNSFFSYFTHLSYIGLCAYFFSAGVQGMLYARCPINKGTFVLSRKWPRFLQFLHVWLYATVVTFPIVVTVVYWVLLSGPKTFSTRFNAWSNVSMHALNTAFVLFELVLTNVPPVLWIYLPLCILVLACYLGLAYITYATLHFYVYSFLNPKKGPILAAYIIGIFVGECVVYVLVHLVAFLRQKVVKKRSVGTSRSASAEEKEQCEDEGVFGGTKGNSAEEGRKEGGGEELEEWQQVSLPESFDGVARAL